LGISEEAQDPVSRLRQRAEDALRGKRVDLTGLPIEDIQKLVHELQVHQIELTLQNEELRRIQLELETARDQFSNLYNFAPVGYCTLDRKGRILEVNLTLAILLGVKPEKLRHKQLSEFVDREDQDAYYLHQERVFENEPHQVTDIQIVNQAGARVFVGLEGLIDHEEPTRVHMILSDITERKEAEKALAQYAKELERSNQALRDFSFIASHDLKEPLRKVKSFGEMLLAHSGEALGDEGKNYLTRMMLAAARMDSLLRGLLAYSRVTTQAVPFAVANLSKIAAEVLSDLETRLMETGGKVAVGELPAIQADPLQMRQLFQNLIGNALKYHRPDVPPLVSVTSRPVENGRIEIIVQDNGIGLDMQYADYIFEPFTRLNGKPAQDGAGMGLTICKKIIERYNGTVSVSSRLDQGSTFTVTLPR
jgi:PAS domain S-box-containing protein